MWAEFRRSLAFKLFLAFLAVTITVALLGIGITQYITRQEFSQLVSSNARASFSARVLTYYQEHGSWEGLNLQTLERVAPLPTPSPPQPQPRREAQPRPSGYLMMLADAEGKVIIPVPPYRQGDYLPEDLLAEGEPLLLDGEQIGTVITLGGPPPYDPRERHYLQRSNRALLYAALGATLLALALSLWFSRQLTLPLRRLTAAIRSMAGGRLGQQVDLHSRDEVGELAEAFNQMSRELARLNAQREQMTADIAHDLRTPLTVLSGYLESMADGVLQPTPERLEAMLQEVRRLHRLVADLRTLSLADAGALRLQKTPLDPAELLAQAVSAYQPLAAQQNIHLSGQAADNIPTIHADGDRLLQVLDNLVSNALRHTPPGGQVWCTAKAGEGNDRRSVIFSVRDTGEGIAPQDLPHIFERLYRADKARSEGQSGLGLAIARSLVEAHGGRIWAESTPGMGSAFFFAIPI
ncbi:MAG: HAMP domain-containing protein, partial [Anaerolineae bacterium]